MTLRQLLNVVNNVLGGGSSSYGILDLDNLTTQVNLAFDSGVSTFAQNNLIAQARAWQTGDFFTYSQDEWGENPAFAGPAKVLHDNYILVYPNGTLSVGVPSGNSINFTTVDDLLTYLPDTGSSGSLSTTYVNPITTSAGQFGGDVVALKINIDFSDAGVTAGSSGIRFGDLILTNWTDTTLNGMSVRQLLDLANSVVAGQSTSYGVAAIDGLVANLNVAFNGGSVTSLFRVIRGLLQ